MRKRKRDEEEKRRKRDGGRKEEERDEKEKEKASRENGQEVRYGERVGEEGGRRMEEIIVRCAEKRR